MKPIYMALIAIIVIGVLVDVWPPVGWTLVLLASMAMIANYYSQPREVKQ